MSQLAAAAGLSLLQPGLALTMTALPAAAGSQRHLVDESGNVQ